MFGISGDRIKRPRKGLTGILTITLCIVLSSTYIGYAQQTFNIGQLDQLEQAMNRIVMLEAQIGDSLKHGAGVIVGGDDKLLYIVTANHVVRHGNEGAWREAKEIRIKFKSAPSQIVKGRLLKHIDADNDLAAISVENLSKQGLNICDLYWGPFTDGGSPARGDLVFPVGNPEGTGKWILPLRPDGVAKVKGPRTIIQSDLIKAGYSGGALLNEYGQVLGMILEDNPPFGVSLGWEKVLEILTTWEIPIQLNWPLPSEINGVWRTQKALEEGPDIFVLNTKDGLLKGYSNRQRIYEAGACGKKLWFTIEWDSFDYGKRAIRYIGTIKDDEIQFMAQDQTRHYNFVADRVIDRTKVSQNEVKTNEGTGTASKYIFRYKLPGHKGGVNSLSFSPLEERELIGMQRLMSGGLRDGLVKSWNLFMATHLWDKKSHYPGIHTGKAFVRFSTATREVSGVRRTDFEGIFNFDEGRVETFSQSEGNGTSSGRRDYKFESNLGPIFFFQCF